MKGVTKGNIKKYALNEFLTEYKELNTDNKYRPVAVGRYGIRKRESIYSKELAKDYSKNKLIHKGTLTVGMGSKQIDIGILIEDETFAVSPAYHTYEIQGIRCKYLEYCLQSKNIEMFSLYAKRGSRQGKSIDLKRWLTYKIPVYSEKDQIVIEENLNKINYVIELRRKQIDLLDELVKARFVEMFGDPRINPMNFNKSELKDTCDIITGNTPSRKNEEYYGDYIEWIKTDNIVVNKLNPTYAKESLSKEGMDVGRTVEKNCILMACIAGSISSIGRVCVTDRKVAFNQQINAIVPKKYNCMFLYVLMQVSKDYLVDGINMALKGILSKSRLEKKQFIVPPLELQNQFASFVQEIDKSRSRIQKSLEASQELFDSLMQEYFG